MPRTRKFTQKSKRQPLGKRQAKAVRALAKKEINKSAEWKYHGNLVTAAVTNVGAVTAVMGNGPGITPGTAQSQRIGNEITLSSISFRYQMLFNTLGNQTQHLRVMLIQMHTDSVPTLGSVIDLAGPYVASTQSVNKPYNTEDRDHKVLYDRTHTLRRNYATEAPESKYFIKKVKVPRRRIEFTTNTTGHNFLYLIYFSDSGSNGPSLDWASRINYMDM